MPRPCPGRLAGGTGARTARRALLPRGVYAAGRAQPLALQNPRVVYTLLFQTVAETLQTIARDPKHLGAEIGFLGVLHTWGQTLHHHPHIHCLVPAGGWPWMAPPGCPCPQRFFLPVRVLSRLFRRSS